MTPLDAIFWALAVLVWVCVLVVLWAVAELAAEAIGARRHKPADLRPIEGGEDDA